uniref:Uncharacterized protein n=1 Tax=Opuntia streptacantha TaxID=393608 RepID=A0A7C9DPC5_OPUST
MVSTLGSINRKHHIVRPKPVSLSVTIGKDTTLEQLVIRVINPRNHHTRAKSELLVLSKEVVDIPVEHQTAYWLEGHQVLRPNLCHVKWIKFVFVLVSWVHDLDVQLPLRIVPCGNRLIEVLGSMAMVQSSNSDSLIL